MQEKRRVEIKTVEEFMMTSKGRYGVVAAMSLSDGLMGLPKEE